MLWLWVLVVPRCQGMTVPLPEYNAEVSACVEAIVERFLASKCLAFLFPLDLANPSTVYIPAQVRSDLLQNLHLRVAPTLPASSSQMTQVPVEKRSGALNRLRCAHVVVLDEGKSYVEQIDNVMYSNVHYNYVNGGGDETKMVVIGPGQFEEADVYQLLRYMYTMGDIDVIFLGLRGTVVEMLTYYPFSDCPDESKSVEEVDFWVNGSFSLGRNLFPKKIPLRFNGCPFNVSVVDHPPYMLLKENQQPYGGIEFRILGIISHHIEMNMSFLGHDYWVSVKDDVPTGAAVEVMLGRSLLMASSGYDLDFSYPHFSVVYPYMFTKIFWFFENPRAVPSWKLVFLPFSKTVWALDVTVAVLYYFCLLLVSRNQRKPRYFSRILKTLQVPSHLPSDLSCSFRVAFGFWLFYVFHINLAYTAILSCLLTTGKMEPKITSFEQISNRGITTVLKTFFYFTTTAIEDPTIRKVLSQRIIIDNYDEILFQMSENYAILEEELFFEYMTKKNNYDVYKSNLHIGLHSVGILMRRNHFLAGRISDLSSRLFESGLVSHIKEDYTRYHEDKKSIKGPLTIEELVGPFCILAVGLFVSFLVFLGEIIIGKRNNKAIHEFHMC